MKGDNKMKEFYKGYKKTFGLSFKRAYQRTKSSYIISLRRIGVLFLYEYSNMTTKEISELIGYQNSHVINDINISKLKLYDDTVFLSNYNNLQKKIQHKQIKLES